MADNTNIQPDSDKEGEFAGAWSRFVRAVQRLLSGAPQQRALDPYLPLRDAALAAAASPRLAADLEKAWSQLHARGQKDSLAPQLAHLLLTEVSAFPSAVEIAEAEEKANKEPSLSKRSLAAIGRTTLDSVKDVLDELPPLAKGTLTILGEVWDIFRGD
jgi:hypothetical protein